MATTTNSRSFARPTIHHSLLDALSEMIARVELEPGSRINEAELCKKFEVSRTPLREAIAVLVADGLLISRPQRGSAVVELSQDTIDELYPVIAGLKAIAAEQVCKMLKSRDFDRLDQIAKATKKAASVNDHEAYFAISVAAHDLLVGTANNALLTRQMRPLLVHARRYQLLAPMSQKCWSRAVASSAAVAAAARDRNAGKLAKAVRQQCSHEHKTTLAWFHSRKDLSRNNDA